MIIKYNKDIAEDKNPEQSNTKQPMIFSAGSMRDAKCIIFDQRRMDRNP